MDHSDAYAADGFWGKSLAYAHAIALTAAFVDPALGGVYVAPGPLVVTDYDIAQTPNGNGVVLLLFDAAAIPAAGRAVFDGTPAHDPVRIIPLLAGQRYDKSLAAPWHRYDNGFVAVMSTDYDTITYASDSTFFAVRYAQAYIGGYAAQRV